MRASQPKFQSAREIKMEKDILVSVNCITYNHAAYIRKCLDGFLMQKTTFRYEVLVHDDASTDGTADIIREYADRYPDIILPYYQTENQYSRGKGFVGGAINRRRARGKYIASCEGDDYWTDPMKLQKQVEYMEEHPDIRLVYTEIDIQDDINGTYHKRVFQSGFRPLITDFKTHLLKRGYIAPCSWMYRHDYFDNTNFTKLADPSFASSLYGFAHHQIAFLPECTAVYRVNNFSVTRTHCNITTTLWRNMSLLETQMYFVDTYPEQFDGDRDIWETRKRILQENVNKFFSLATAVDDKKWIGICRRAIREYKLWNARNTFLYLAGQIPVTKKCLLHRLLRYGYTV